MLCYATFLYNGALRILLTWFIIACIKARSPSLMSCVMIPGFPRNGLKSALQIVPTSGSVPVWKYLRMALALHSDGALAEVCWLRQHMSNCR